MVGRFAACSDLVSPYCRWSFLVFEFCLYGRRTSPKEKRLLPTTAMDTARLGSTARRMAVFRAAGGGVQRRGGTGTGAFVLRGATAPTARHRTSPAIHATISPPHFTCRFWQIAVPIRASTPRRPRPYPSAYSVVVHGIYWVYVLGLWAPVRRPSTAWPLCKFGRESG